MKIFDRRYFPAAKSTYDSFGRVLTAADANGNTTTTTYTMTNGLPTQTAVTNLADGGSAPNSVPQRAVGDTTSPLGSQRCVASQTVAGRADDIDCVPDPCQTCWTTSGTHGDSQSQFDRGDGSDHRQLARNRETALAVWGSGVSCRCRRQQR
jgi:hypothetical protein